MVPAAEDGISVDEQRICEAIDERTALVAVSHVLFRSSFVVKIKPIVRRARRVGAPVMWDVYQSAGCMPVDVLAADVDFAVGGCLKWLCGGPGAGYLYVREELIPQLEPAFTGWQADADAFAFRPGGVRYRDDVWRFLNGTPNVPALLACRPGLAILREVGARAVRAKSVKQTTRLMKAARQRGWPVTASLEPARRGGTVAIDLPNAFEVGQELLERQVIVDYRPGAGIRVSPHFYTSEEECDRLIDEVEEILESGAWEKHADASRRVT
jgi:kynureninase